MYHLELFRWDWPCPIKMAAFAACKLDLKQWTCGIGGRVQIEVYFFGDDLKKISVTAFENIFP